MTYGNYTTGFEYGVIIRELMKPETTTGQNFYVGNHATLLPGEKGASDNNRGTFLQPFSTIDAAYNACKAGRGDRIYVRPGHTLSIANATTLVMDVSGIQLIGLGVGELRPIITFATATSAAIPVSGANNVIANFIFKCNIANQSHMLDLTADDTLIIGNDFREGTATGLSFITADGTDADCDRLRIIGNKFYAPTAGNYDNAISLAKDFVNVELLDNYIYGDFDDAGIWVPAGGNAQVNLQIRGGEVHNIQTNIPAISINGTDSSGTISNVILKTDTQASALDNGSLATMPTVTWASITTDQVLGEPIFTATDGAANILGVDDADNGFASTNVAANRDGSIIERTEYIIQALVDDGATNFIGVDDADNVAATTNVVANADGSMLERLEYIQTAVATDSAVNWVGVDNANNTAATTLVVANKDGTVLERLEALMDPLGGYDPLLGFRVTKTSSMADGAGTDNLFTVTGRCLITHFSGEVTTVIGTTTTMKIRDVTNSVDLCAATTSTTDAVGTMYSLTSITANILNGTGATPVIGSVPNITGALPMPMAIVGDVQAPLTIAHVLDGAGTGAVAWVLYYKPLTAASSIVAAA